MNIVNFIDKICDNATGSRLDSGLYDSVIKNKALKYIHDLIKKNKSSILKNNQLDVNRALKKNISGSFLDRMTLNERRVDDMLKGIKQIIKIRDPLYKTSKRIKQSNGIYLSQMRVPLGTIAMIYESRPNVTIDAAWLCLKSGNSVILKGGSDTLSTNKYLVKLIKTALEKSGMNKNLVQLIDSTDRSATRVLLKKSNHIDVVIPRGGKNLIEMIMRESSVPMIKHLDGNCHVFIDKGADDKIAHSVAMNSKTQRLGVCNAIETLLIHKNYPSMKALRILRDLDDSGIEIRGCKNTKKIFPMCIKASESDWFEEYLGPILAVKIVKDVDEAIAHISKFGSMHTDAIISKNKKSIEKFCKQVDSSSVMVNTSTRFADGFEYGLGAEIGISTDKLHARGPVGLLGLTNLKYIVTSSGKIKK